MTELSPENLTLFIDSLGIFGPAVFILIYFVAILLLFSSAALTILAGLLFGKLWGTIYVIIAATLAAQAAFMISRKVADGRLDNLKNKKRIGPLIKTIEKKCEKNGLQNLIILRCLFLPYGPLSYAAGTVKSLKARDFFLATLITNLIFSPAFVFLGDSLLAGPKALILPVIMIILVLSVPKIVKKTQIKL